MYQLIISKAAAKFLRSNKVNRGIYEAIDKKIIGLKKNPYPVGSKKIKGSNYYRLRHGDYRIVYEIKNKVLVIVIINIAHRKEIYNKI